MTDRSSVLIASGDDAVRARVRLALGEDRFDVHEAVDTDSAVVVLAAELPALLILDAALPGTGALALARSARVQPETTGTRTLLLVSSADQRVDEQAGVDGTLAIPASPFAILRKVEELISGG